MKVGGVGDFALSNANEVAKNPDFFRECPRKHELFLHVPRRNSHPLGEVGLLFKSNVTKCGSNDQTRPVSALKL